MKITSIFEMPFKIARSTHFPLLALLFTSCLFSSTFAIYFKVTQQQPICFHEITHKNNKVLALFDVVASYHSHTIDVQVSAPSGNVVEDFRRKSEGRSEFTALEDGEYSFCFTNTHHNPVEVSFWVNIEEDHGLEGAVREGDVNDMVYQIERLNSLVNAAKVDLEAFKAREARHRQTAESNSRKVVFWSAVECVLIVGVAMAQIYRIKKIFETKRSL